MNSIWSECKFLVIDVEGNGQRPMEIIELAIVSITNGQIQDSFSEWLIKPREPVTLMASRLHGIYNNDLINQPEFESISTEIFTALGNEAVIGHNVSVDIQLLKEKMGSWQPFVAIDTLRLAKAVNPGLTSYGLESLINHYKLDLPDRKSHRAASDAIATAQLFLTLISILENRSPLNLTRLAELSASPNDPYFQIPQQSLF